MGYPVLFTRVKSSISFPAGLAAAAGDEAGDEAGADAGDLVLDAELVTVVFEVVEVVEVLAGEQARLLSSMVVRAAVNIIFFIAGLLYAIYGGGKSFTLQVAPR
jgi:hypothetical protein